MLNSARLESKRLFWTSAAVLIVVHFIIGLLSGPFTITADGQEYLVMAENLRHSGAFTYDGVHPVVGKPPGFPAFVALYLSIVGSLEGFQWVQFGLLYVGYLYVALTIRRHWSSAVALMTLTALVFLWPLHQYTRNLLSEPMFLALSCAGMYLVCDALIRPRWVTAAGAGLLFGLSVYVRPITLVWPAVLLLGLVLFLRPRWKTGLLVLLVQVLVVTPWMLRNWLTFDHFVPMVANWAPLYYMTDEDAWRVYMFEGSGVIRSSPEYQAITNGEFPFNWSPNRRFRDLALDRIADAPAEYIGRCTRQALFAWTYVPGTKAEHGTVWFEMGRIAMLLFFALTIVGAIRFVRSGRQVYVLLTFAYAVSTGMVLFPVFTESRYLVPVYMWFLPLAVVGAFQLTGRIFRMPVWLRDLSSPQPNRH